MIGDIFYLYIHPKDHRYNVFYTKKKIVRGFRTHTFTKASP